MKGIYPSMYLPHEKKIKNAKQFKLNIWNTGNGRGLLRLIAFNKTLKKIMQKIFQKDAAYKSTSPSPSSRAPTYQ